MFKIKGLKFLKVLDNVEEELREETKKINEFKEKAERKASRKIARLEIDTSLNLVRRLNKKGIKAVAAYMSGDTTLGIVTIRIKIAEEKDLLVASVIRDVKSQEFFISFGKDTQKNETVAKAIKKVLF